ncbi:diguanylate phosphodiesterase [Alteromonadales bacterium alter-6D02]|nr:diguanylate phosphodiesterase [Alteromonadales bacterium alter-6D02]
MSDIPLVIIEDNDCEQPKLPLDSWKVVIIDDEQSVHDVTKLALSDIVIQDKRLEFYSAYSAKEGFDLLGQHRDCAVILLDVVMESSEAGLELAERIRHELHMEMVQIILRTGQPGYAPEEDIIKRYEINDYKTKNELTRNKLYTALATAIRSFGHLSAISESKKGLRNVIDASANLMKEHSVHDFASGVLQQINALLKISTPGIFCVSQRPLLEADNNGHLVKESYLVVATSKKFSEIYGVKIDEISQLEAREIAQLALSTKKHVFNESMTALFLSTPSDWTGVVVLEGQVSLSRIDEELLQVFCLNVALGLENAKFFTRLNKAAYYDGVTSLFNNTGFIESAKKVIQQANERVTLFVIDIDYFHDIVESLGFEFGNKVLKAMTSNLKRTFSAHSVISRLHSDVFAVLLADTDMTVKDVVKECSKPFIVEGSSIRLGVSIGEAHHESAEANFNVETVLRHAKIALRVAKESKRGAGQEFEPHFEDEARSRLGILADLRNGLDQEELFLVLQPKVSMGTGEVVGYEALVRWEHPQKGIIPPNAFIPVAEQSGMYFDIDMYVFRKSLEILEKHPNITKPISVNISANSLHHSEFIEELKAVMNTHPFDINKIELEITENALVRSDMAIQHLNELKALGFVLCLDDFGAGYSSLSYLLKLPLDVIKIDRSFVNYISDDSNAMFVLKGMLQICYDLNKTVVVEGVETLEQVDLLTQQGVDIAQGFYYFKPMSIDEILVNAC